MTLRDREGGLKHDDQEGASQRRELSPRQRQILELLREGKANKEIARELGIGVGTVKQHVVALFKRLNVRNRAMAVSHGMALLDDESKEESPTFTEEGMLVRRPCVVLSIALPLEADADTARQLYRTLAGLAYDSDALFLARKGNAGDLIFGVQHTSGHDVVAAVQLARALYTDLLDMDRGRYEGLRGALMAGMAIVSARRHGGWSGEAVASPVIAEAREALRDAVSGELLFGPAAREVMRAFGFGLRGQMPERLPFAELKSLRRADAVADRVYAGRTAEAMQVAGILREATSGRGRLVIVEGETGMGKSRLCRAAATLSGALKRPAHLFHCLPTTVTSVIWRAESGELDSVEALATQLLPDGNALPQLHIVDDVHLLRSEERTRLLEAAREAVAAGQVVLLAGRRVVRGEEPGAEVIRLRNLSLEATEMLLRQNYPERDGDELGALALEAAGVPLFAMELAQAKGSRVPPLSLLMVITSRLDDFELDWKLLRTLARHSSVTLSVLVESLGEEEGDVRRAVKRAVDVGVLQLDGESAVAFRHPLIQRVIDYLGVD